MLCSFLFFPAPSSAFSSTYQFNPTTTPSSFAFSLVRPFSQPIFKHDNLEAARLLPTLSLPPLSSPLQRHCGFSNVLPLSPGRRRVDWEGGLGEGRWHGALLSGEVSTLAGFPPSMFWTHRLVLVGPTGDDNGGVVVVTLGGFLLASVCVFRLPSMAGRFDSILV